MTHFGMTRRAAFTGLGSSMLALVAGHGLAAPISGRQTLATRQNAFDSLSFAVQRAQSLNTGDQVRVIQFNGAGPLGGFDGVVESAPNPMFPGGGRIRPTDALVRPQWWGAGAGNAQLDAAALESAAAYIGSLGSGKLVISERYVLQRPVNMDIPEWTTIDADGAVFIFDSESATINVNPSADIYTTHNRSTRRGISWRGGRFLRSQRNQTGTAFKPPLTRQFSIREAYFEGFKTAIAMTGKDTLTLADNYFYQNETGIEFIGGLIPDQKLAGNAPIGVNIERNHFSVRGMRCAIGIREKLISVSIAHNVIAGATASGAHIEIEDGPANNRAERFEIIGNHLEQIGERGAISVSAPNGRGVYGLTIENNSFATSRENSSSVIRLTGTESTHIGRNTLYLSNPASGINAFILVDADRSNSDLWIDRRQYMGGRKERMSLITDAQYRENAEIHLFPNRISERETWLGSWFAGTNPLPPSGNINILRDLPSRSKQTVPQKLRLTPRRVRVSGFIEAISAKGSSPTSERIVFAPSSRATGSSEYSHVYQLAGLQAGGRVNVEMWLTVDPSEGSVFFALEEQVPGTTRGNLHIDEYEY